MDFSQAITLGIVQGLGEFLPISSTAHLILAPYFFGWQDPGLAFDVALHGGTLLALLVYFRRDWFGLVKSLEIFWQKQSEKILNSNKKKSNDSEKIQGRLLWKLLIIGSIPAVAVGYFLNDYAEGVWRSPWVVAGALISGALFLALADRYFVGRKKISQMTVLNAWTVGIFQALAIIPGVSRSGATMTAGLLQGFSRSQAARFSFLLSAPIILGAVLLEIPKVLGGPLEFKFLLAGVLSAALSGYAAIAFLLKLVQSRSFTPFVVYRILLALIILMMLA